jgi:hypothetical protein
MPVRPCGLTGRTPRGIGEPKGSPRGTGGASGGPPRSIGGAPEEHAGHRPGPLPRRNLEQDFKFRFRFSFRLLARDVPCELP